MQQQEVFIFIFEFIDILIIRDVKYQTLGDTTYGSVKARYEYDVHGTRYDTWPHPVT